MSRRRNAVSRPCASDGPHGHRVKMRAEGFRDASDHRYDQRFVAVGDMFVPMPLETVTARACANIALVKYWGKRDAALNLPAAGSLSLTLAALSTETTVRFGAE